ncbi:MAG TPA: DUF1634 domain-containing protein [Thermomicrobiaceae bacterium]|nr:DUF1634 domain-containing protein [Thermomicrobiaceae bacterium]
METTKTFAGARSAKQRAESSQPPSGGHPMELWISYALRIGVVASGLIILLGVVMLLAGVGSTAGVPGSLDQILGGGGHAIAVSPASIAHGVAAGSPIAIIQLGVIALILTPMLRVGLTVGLFAAQREPIFVAITSVVLTVLIIGLIGFGA